MKTSELKNELFQFLKEILNPHSTLAEYVFIVLEGIFMLHYSFSSALRLQRMVGAEQLKAVLSYMHLVEIEDSNLSVIGLYLCLMVWLMHFLNIKFKLSIIYSAMYRIGTFAIFQGTLKIILCDFEKCYRGIYILHVVVAVLLLLCFTLQMTVLSLKWDKNPFHNSEPRYLFSGQGGLDWVAKVLFKLLVVAGYIYIKDFNGYIIVLIGVHVGNLFFFRINSMAFNRPSFQFELVVEAANLWVAFAVIIEHFNQGGHNDYSILPSIVATPFFSMIIIFYHRMRLKQLLKTPIQNIQNFQDLTYLYNVVMPLANSKDPQFVNVVAVHAEECQERGCICWKFLEMTLQNKQDNNQMLKHFIQSSIAIHRKEWQIKFLLGTIMSECEKSCIRGLHVMMHFKQNKLDILQQFSLFCMKEKARTILRQVDKKKKSEINNQFESVAFFNESVLSLQNQIRDLMGLLLNFLRELLEYKPMLDKLLFFACRVEQKKKHILMNFQELISQNRSHKKLRELCRIYFRKFDQDQQRSILSKDASFNSSALQLLPKELVVISMAVFGSELGIIKGVNEDCFSVLGYQRQQLVGQKIIKLMPKMFYEIHDLFIESFLSREDSKISYKRLQVPVVHSNGYVCMCHAFLRIHSDPNSDLNMIAFVKPFAQGEGEHYLVFNFSQQRVEGLSASFQSLLGLQKINIQNLALLDLNKIFPDLNYDYREGNAKFLSFEKVNVSMDLNYLFEEIQELCSQAQEIGTLKVRLQLISDVRYNQLRVMIIKIIQIQTRSIKASEKDIQTPLDDLFGEENDQPFLAESTQRAKLFEPQQFKQRFQLIKSSLVAVNVIGAFLIVLLVTVNLSLLSSYSSSTQTVIRQMFINNQRLQYMSVISIRSKELSMVKSSNLLAQYKLKVQSLQYFQFLTQEIETSIPQIKDFLAKTPTNLYQLVFLFEAKAFLFLEALSNQQSTSQLLTDIKDLTSQIWQICNRLVPLSWRLLQSRLDEIWRLKVLIMVSLIVWTLVNGFLQLLFILKLKDSENQVIQLYNSKSKQQVLQNIRSNSTVLDYFKTLQKFEEQQKKKDADTTKSIELSLEEHKFVFIEKINTRFDFITILVLVLFTLAFVMGEFLYENNVIQTVKPIVNSFNLIQNSTIVILDAQFDYFEQASKLKDSNQISFVQFDSLFNIIFSNDNYYRSNYTLSPIFNNDTDRLNNLSFVLAKAQSGRFYLQLQAKDNRFQFNALFFDNLQLMFESRNLLNVTSMEIFNSLLQFISSNIANYKSYEQVIFLTFILFVYVLSGLNLKMEFQKHQKALYFGQLSNYTSKKVSFDKIT